MRTVQSQPQFPFKRGPIAALLLAGGFIAILNQTLMITAIPVIMKQMHISASSAQWLTTVFMMVNGVMIPVTAFLIERFTTRKLFISAMSIFAFGTVISGIAPNFDILLFGRVVQSAGAGIMMPLMQTVFLMIFPVAKRGAAMGMIGLVISFAPAIGPALSGWVMQSYSWRFLFVIIFPIAIIDMIIAFFTMKNVTKLTHPKVDAISITLSSFGFGGLLYGFSNAGNVGWGSPHVLIALAIGAVSLFFFIFRQYRMKHPMLEFRVFQHKIFLVATAISMIVFMGLIGGETLIPLYLQNMRGYSAMESGILLLPGALVMGLMSPITGRIFDKIGARLLAMVGLTILAMGTVPYTVLTPSTSFTFLTVMYAVRLFGISMVMMPITTAGLNQLPNRLIPHGTAMINTMRQVAGSMGTAFLVTVYMMSAQGVSISRPAIHGINVAFMIVTILAFLCILLSFFVKKTAPSKEKEEKIYGKKMKSEAR